MSKLPGLIRANNGLAPTHRLLAAGVTPAALAWSVRAGTLVRVRKGWYCLPAVATILQQAARIGGRLTGPSAAELAGSWAPPEAPLHVAVAPNACRLRDRDNFRRRLAQSQNSPVVVHWTDDRAGGSPFVRSPEGWLRDAALNLAPEWAVAMADSAIHAGILDWLSWESVRSGLPDAIAQRMAIVDGVPDSGTESIARFLLAGQGIHARSRAVVADGKEVDLLVGDRLVIELDSELHHGSRAKRLADLGRDAELAAINYIVLRFDYVHVMFTPQLMLDAVIAKVGAGEHLWTRWI